MRDHSAFLGLGAAFCALSVAACPAADEIALVGIESPGVHSGKNDGISVTLLNRGGATVALTSLNVRALEAPRGRAYRAISPAATLAPGARLRLVVPVTSTLPAGYLAVEVSYRSGEVAKKTTFAARLARAATIDPSAVVRRKPRIVSVRMGALSGGRVRLRLELELSNVLDAKIDIAHVALALAISGNRFGSGRSDPLALAPRETRRVGVDVVADRGAVSKTVRAMLGKRARFVASGEIVLAGGKRARFSAEAGAEVFGAPARTGTSKIKP